MRGISACVVVVLMCLGLAGCGGDSTKQTDTSHKITVQETQKNDVASDIAPGGTSEMVQTLPAGDGKKGSLSVAADKSVELPKGYPSDKFPLYKGSYIYSAMEVEGSYVLTAYSKDDVKQVIAFYENVLNGAHVNMDTKTDESLTSMGTKSGYAYTLDVGKSNEKGYLTTISISLQPAN